MHDMVVELHHTFGIDSQDPNSTWQWSRYAPPENTRHESNANNRWHLLLLSAAAVVAVWRFWKYRDSRWLIYGTALFAAFFLFCFYLRWQPYGARLFVPLLIFGAPLVGLVLEAMRPQIVALVTYLFLLDGARLPVLENWTRPLRGPQSVLEIDCNANYFADIGSMNNRDSYLEAVNLVARSGCDIVGIDASRNQLEYPFQALLRQRNAAVRFRHVGVENSSQRYSKRDEPQPCAVLCLDCAGDERKTAAYRGIGPVTTVGRFLLFLKHLI